MTVPQVYALGYALQDRKKIKIVSTRDNAYLLSFAFWEGIDAKTRSKILLIYAKMMMNAEVDITVIHLQKAAQDKKIKAKIATPLINAELPGFVALTRVVRTEKFNQANVSKIEIVQINSIAFQETAARENKTNKRALNINNACQLHIAIQNRYKRVSAEYKLAILTNTVISRRRYAQCEQLMVKFARKIGSNAFKVQYVRSKQ